MRIFTASLGTETNTYAPAQHTSAREVEERLRVALETRPTWQIIGTSLLSELGVLGLACWIFVRRDY